MDQLKNYRTIIQQLLEGYAQFGSGDEAIEIQLLTDTTHDHYQLMHIGWQDERRVYGCILHLDIKDGKIWLQHNGTEEDIPAELVKMGVPKTDIVVGFHSPFKRQFTEYAVS